MSISYCSTSMSGVPLFDDLYSFRGSAPPFSKSEKREEAVESGFDNATEAEEEQEDDTSNDTNNNSGNRTSTQSVATA